ncbi:MAG: flippase-like domain-containing protein [Deltaproteobacteria bacterium]|nr:flippase-like domain-containing protein [Deltaproteobacteria bacterium]
MMEPEEPSGPVPEASRAIRRGFLSAGIGLALVVLAIVVVSRTQVGAEGLADLVRRARWGPLLLAWVFMSNAYLILGLRWRELMPREHWPPVLGLTSIQCVGLLLNYAVPGPFGEVGSAWFAGRRYGVPFSSALASAVAGRVIGLVSAALLAVGCWALFDLPVPEGLDAPIGAIAVALGLGGAAGVWVAARPEFAQGLAHRLLAPLEGPGLLGRAAKAVGTAVASVAEALTAVARRGLVAWARASGWSLLGHASVTAGIGVVAWSLGASPSIPGLLFTYTAVTSATVLLYAAPGSQVAWDAMLVGLLVGASGLVLPDALAVVLVIRIQQITIMAIGAGALVWLVRTNPSPS